MKEVKSIKFNFIMNLIRVLMTIVFPLITYPYATRVLNSAGVGRAAYVASIVSYFQLVASFGVNNARSSSPDFNWSAFALSSGTILNTILSMEGSPLK